MAPSAVNNGERRPSVPHRHHLNDFGGNDAPPAKAHFQQLHEEPEIGQLFNLAGSSVIVTGGARGLGLTMAAASLESGADVLCCDILPEPSYPEWNVVLEKSKRFNVTIKYVQLDICDSELVEKTFKEFSESARFPVRGVVHAAGVMDEQLAKEYEMKAFSRVMRINVDGTMNVAKAAARAMRASNEGGSIVLIASISGQITNRGITTTAYSSSKAACLQMARSLAVEWAPDNIRVNTISPGYIRSAMTNSLLANNEELLRRWEDSNPLGRIGNPSDLKGPAIFLLSQASHFVTGTDFRIDGGHCAW